MNLLINSDKLTNLADSFREKLNTNEQFTIDEMTDSVEELKYITNPYISLEKSEGSSVIDTAVYNGFEEIKVTDIVESKENIVVGEGTLSVRISKYAATTMRSGDIKKIVLPSSLERINAYAFQYLNELTEINIPDSVVSVGDNAFDHCRSLESISFPDSVTRLENYVLSYTNIDEFYIHDTVTYIGRYAFQGTLLKKIFIPSTVTTIDAPNYSDTPFSNCKNLEIYTDAPSKPSGWGLYFNRGGSSTTFTVHYGVSREEFENLSNE